MCEHSPSLGKGVPLPDLRLASLLRKSEIAPAPPLARGRETS